MRILVPTLLAWAAWAPQALAAADTAPALDPAPPGAGSATTARVLTLAEALRSALQHQPTLQQQRAATRVAEAQADQSKSSLLPQVSATLAYERATANSATTGTHSDTSTGDTFSGSATVSQLLWDFKQTSGKWHAAQATATAQRATEHESLNEVLLNVQSAFFAARAAKHQVAVYRDNLANIELHLKQTEGYVRAGTHAEIDLAQSRTDLANARVSLINAENTYANDKTLLNQAIGIDEASDYEVSDEQLSAVQGEELTVDALLPEALKNRPDIASFESKIRAQELTQEYVAGAYWPSLGFTTGVTTSGPGLDNMYQNWYGQLALSWDVYQGGLTRAKAREAGATLASLKAQLAAERQQVRVDVEQYWRSVRAYKETLVAAEEAYINAKEKLRQAEARYRTGVGNAVELSDAQSSLTSAAGQRVTAEYNLSAARAQLVRALGRVPQI